MDEQRDAWACWCSLLSAEDAAPGGSPKEATVGLGHLQRAADSIIGRGAYSLPQLKGAYAQLNPGASGVSWPSFCAYMTASAQAHGTFAIVLIGGAWRLPDLLRAFQRKSMQSSVHTSAFNPDALVEPSPHLQAAQAKLVFAGLAPSQQQTQEIRRRSCVALPLVKAPTDNGISSISRRAASLDLVKWLSAQSSLHAAKSEPVGAFLPPIARCRAGAEAEEHGVHAQHVPSRASADLRLGNEARRGNCNGDGETAGATKTLSPLSSPPTSMPNVVTGIRSFLPSARAPASACKRRGSRLMLGQEQAEEANSSASPTTPAAPNSEAEEAAAPKDGPRRKSRRSSLVMAPEAASCEMWYAVAPPPEPPSPVCARQASRPSRERRPDTDEADAGSCAATSDGTAKLLEPRPPAQQRRSRGGLTPEPHISVGLATWVRSSTLRRAEAEAGDCF